MGPPGAVPGANQPYQPGAYQQPPQYQQPPYPPPPPPPGYYPPPGSPPQPPTPMGYYPPTMRSDDIWVPGGMHSPGLGVLFGLLLVGGGAFYNRQYIKGVVMLVGAMFLGIMTLGFAFLVTWPVSAIDGYMVAQRLQRGEVVGQWQWF